MNRTPAPNRIDSVCGHSVGERLAGFAKNRPTTPRTERGSHMACPAAGAPTPSIEKTPAPTIPPMPIETAAAMPIWPAAGVGEGLVRPVVMAAAPGASGTTRTPPLVSDSLHQGYCRLHHRRM